MRILFAIHSLERGGAERVISTMANYWASTGHDVIIMTIASQKLDAYRLHNNVRRVALNMASSSKGVLQKLTSNLCRLLAVRRAVKRIAPDVLVSFTTNVNCLTVLALFGLDIPVVISERMDPEARHLGRFRNWLRKYTYPKAALLVVQTEHAKSIMRRKRGYPPIVVVPNPIAEVDPDGERGDVSLRAMLSIPADVKVIAGMGRLGPEKGFDLLISAFDRITKDFPNWHLVIFGEGAGRQSLEKQIHACSLQRRVHLPGLVYTARKYLSQTDLFVLSSRVEGFPNVLLEAMACGIPVVSVDCLSGPSDIVRNRFDGLLVESENVPALASAMTELMSANTLRDELGQNARYVLDRFSLNRIMGLWDQLIIDVMRKNANNSIGSR